MSTISGIGGTPSNFWQVNRMTQDLIRSKDANGDKTLSTEEFGGPQDAFALMDRNNDGQLGAVELNKAGMEAAADQRTTEFIASRDKNSDSLLDASELQLPSEVFTRIDADGSGSVGVEELQQAFRARHAVNQYQQALQANTAPQPTSASSIIA